MWVVRLVGKGKTASETGLRERAECCSREDQRKVAASAEKF